METTALAVVEPQEAVSLLESPLSPAETAELQSCELAIELAGKDRLEKALIIGEKLSTIYNHALFRGAGGGCTWEQWVATRLPELLPGEATGKIDWADDRRFIHETRSLLLAQGCASAPASIGTSRSLQALIPRRFSGPSGWNPAVLDDSDAAQGIAKVWELARLNAERNQRRNGPTAEDVRAAREELRPVLEQQGLIRSAPASFQAATAARVEAARQRTITVNPEEEERKAAAFRETMASIRASATERQAKVAANEVHDEATKAEREHQQLLEQEVRSYNSKLQGASGAIHDLLTYLQNLSRVHGTQLLDEMRCTDVLGLISVRDDIQRLQEAGQDLIAAVKLAQSSDPPSGIDMSTFTV